MKKSLMLLGLLGAITAGCGAHESVELPDESTRFFWSDKVDESLVINLMKLMNYCLAQKIESELFYNALKEISDQLEKITIASEEKNLLQERIATILVVLNSRIALSCDQMGTAIYASGDARSV